MNLIFQIFSGDGLFDGAAEALQHRLCKSDGELKELYKEYKNAARMKKLYPDCEVYVPSSKGRRIIIAMLDGKPVGSAIIMSDHLQMYVLRSHRRQGIGTATYQKAMKVMGRKVPFNVWKCGRTAKGFFNAVEKGL